MIGLHLEFGSYVGSIRQLRRLIESNEILSIVFLWNRTILVSQLFDEIE